VVIGYDSQTRRSFVRLVASSALLFGACNNDQKARLGPTLDGMTTWRLTPPEDLGLDANLLERASAYIATAPLRITGFVVVSQGRPVTEHYYLGSSVAERSDRWSITKSVTSVLVGIALARGDIESLEQPMTAYLEDSLPSRTSRQINRIRLRHLLTMTAGFAGDVRGGFDYTFQDDWVSALLNRELVSDPGTRWAYDSGSSHLISAVITKATGMAAAQFASTHLFPRLGIDGRVPWPSDPKGVSTGGWGIQLTAREMAKLGYLLLCAGRWNGRQVMPAEYASKSTADAVATRGSDADGYGYRWPGYGYYWWRYPGHGSEAGFAALGYGGQLILVWPNKDAVCVVTTSGSDDDWSARRLLSGMVLPAVKAKTLA
jgi:CubicO group peptidase (beta-lactamase class C family)